MKHEIELALNILADLFVASFRDFSFNDLTELPPGIFDSLASLTLLYVLVLVAEISFVSFLL